MIRLTDSAWSPYAAGIVIGLLQIPAFMLADTALGASSSFVTAAAWIASIFDPAAAQIDYFAKHMTSDKYYWQSALVIGIALGAYISARLGGVKRPSFAKAWSELTSVKSLGGRMIMGFVGGFILLIYLLFSGILFLCARILRRTPSYRDCRYIAGSSFWLPMAALAPIAIVAILLTGGDHVRADLIPYLLPVVFAIVFILPIWGLAVQILTVSEALQASVLRAAGIVLLSVAAFLALSLGPLFLAFTLLG